MPAQETAMRREVREAMKRVLPIQSMLRSFVRRLLLGFVRAPRKKNVIGRAMVQMGRLSQKHQRHVARSTNRPPTRGPRSEPRAQAPSTMVKYLGRSRKGTRSA